MNKKPVEDA